VKKLYADIHNALKKLNLTLDDKPWKPHITLGRIKDTGESLRGMDKISPAPIQWTADKLELIESKLTPTGPKYRTLFEHGLGLDKNN